MVALNGTSIGSSILPYQTEGPFMNNEESMNDKKERKINRIAIFSFLIVLAFVIGWSYLLITEHSPINEIIKVKFDNTGEFGDSFGIITALFSGLAFVGMIWTIFLQKHEIALQRYELRQTREEFERSRKEYEKQTQLMDKQNSAIDRQIFETTFFNLLTRYDEIIKSLSLSIVKGDYHDINGDPECVEVNGKYTLNLFGFNSPPLAA